MEVANALSYTFNSVRHQMVCGPDAISGLPGVLERARASRAMVLCGPSILAHSDVVPRVQEVLVTALLGCTQASRLIRPSPPLTPLSLWPARPDRTRSSASAAAALTTPPRVPSPSGKG